MEYVATILYFSYSAQFFSAWHLHKVAKILYRYLVNTQLQHIYDIGVCGRPNG